MPSKSKSESARINGAKSKGPVTPEGKARSSRNALRHGLTAGFTLLVSESQPDFQLFLDAYIHRYQPADAVEMDLVQSMAIARWRLRRMANLEASLLENEVLLTTEEIDQQLKGIDDGNRLAYAFEKLAREGRSLALLSRYETALNRQFERALKQLNEVQNRPLPNEPTEPLTHHLPAASPQLPSPGGPSRHSSVNPCHSPVSASLPGPPDLFSEHESRD
jgi:hypothetical protein